MILGTAWATAGAVGGVVAVVVAPMLIVVLLARSGLSCRARTDALSAPMVTTALPPIIAANILTVRELVISHLCLL